MSRRRSVDVWLRGQSPGLTPSLIEIVAAPPGEAPLNVRRAWIGLQLPLAVEGLHDLETMGVVSGRRWRFATWLARRLGRYEMMQGYLVDARSAIECLAKTSPEAADWWRKNTPDLLKPGQRLIFPALVSRPCKTPLPEPANQG